MSSGSFRTIYKMLRKSIGLGRPLLPREIMRPFRMEDLKPVPEGWKVGPPDFVGIASGKAGTTWWYLLLLEHPSVKPNRLSRKELSYFNHFGYNDLGDEALRTYRQGFAAPPGCICGEWSPGYLTYPIAIHHLARAAPDTKLLAIVRNPVDHTLSSINQGLSVWGPAMKIRANSVYIYKTYSLFPLRIYQSLLYRPFKRLLDVFDRSQILLLQYEKCILNPTAEISRTYRFLGLDDSYVPRSLHRKVNARTHLIPELTSQNRKILAEYFCDDIQSFVNLFPEIDLSHWPDFST